MKAAIAKKYGPPSILTIQETVKPLPKDNEVLIKVYAATVNRTDCAILRAKPFIMRFFTGLLKPKNPIPGTDFAGIIEAVGKDVQSFKTGDKVFGFDDKGVGSHAGYMTFPESKAIAVIPDNTSYEEAAASLEGVHYAYNFYNKVTIKSGEKILVNGATGAIGSAVVQFLNSSGAAVTATCGTDNMELVKSLGASSVIDYTKEDFTKNGKKYKYVFDAVGKSSFGKCKPLLESRGIYISSELGKGSQNIFLALFTPLFGRRKVIFPVPSNCKRSVHFIKQLIEQGKFKAVIDKIYPLEEIADAYTYAESGQKIGNIIITMHDNHS